MKQNFSLLILTSLFLTSGCWSDQPLAGKTIQATEGELVTVLFSDEHHMEDEGNYYDALLDIKNKFPDKINSVEIVLSNERDLIRSYNISSYPTLLIMNDETVKTRIEGPQATNEIIAEIEQTLEIAYTN